MNCSPWSVIFCFVIMLALPCITLNLFAQIPKILNMCLSRCRSNFISPLFLRVLLLIPLGVTQSYGANVSVVLSGSGQGSINSSPPGIICPGTCAGTFDTISLYSNPATNSFFSGWGGACTGLEDCASLTLDSDKTVNAIFELKPAQIRVSGSNYGSIQAAYKNVMPGGKILVVALDQAGDLTLDEAINFKVEGGFDDAFTSNAGNRTKLHGSVIIREGSLRVNRLALVSSVQAMTPSSPTGVIATAGDSQAVISWNDVPGATSYNVYYSISPGVSRSNGARVVGAIKGNAVSGLTNGVTYYFVVTAAGAGGESVESSQVIVTPFNAVAPSSPDLVTASAGSGEVEVGWSDVAGATSYSVYWSTSPGVTTATGTKVSPIAASPYQHTGLANGTTYYYIATANIGATESVASPEASAKPAAAAVNPRLLKRSIYAVKEKKTTKTYTLYEYDASSGLVAKERNYAYAETDIFTGYFAFEYDSNGNVTKKSSYNPNGDLFSYITTMYNSAGNPTLISNYIATGVYSLLIEYISNEYDSSTGKLLKKSSSINGLTGLVTAYTVYEYDASGNLTKKTSYGAGATTGYTTYEYNADALEIMRASYGATGLLGEYVKIEYNAAKKMVSESTYNGFTGLLTKYSIVEYGATNKPVKISNYDFANNLTGYSTLVYNKAGKRTMITIYDETGVVTARTTDEYGY